MVDVIDWAVTDTPLCKIVPVRQVLLRQLAISMVSIVGIKKVAAATRWRSAIILLQRLLLLTRIHANFFARTIPVSSCRSARKRPTALRFAWSDCAGKSYPCAL